MVNPILLLSACAMLIGVAVGEQPEFPSESSCDTFTNQVKAGSKLPNEPPVKHIELTISRHDAKLLIHEVPDKNKKLKGKEFQFVVTLGNCKRTVGSFTSFVKSNRDATRTRSRKVVELNKLINPNTDLIPLYMRLSGSSTGIDISRGNEYIKVHGVKLRRGDRAHMCLASPGWECTSVLEVKDRHSKKTLITKEYEPTFFSAVEDGRSLIQSTWVVERKK